MIAARYFVCMRGEEQMSKTCAGEARYRFDSTTNVHHFCVNLHITQEVMSRLRLFSPHRKTLEAWSTATFFARMSTLAALAKAVKDQT